MKRALLALDLASNSGFCIGAPATRPLIGSVRLAKRGDGNGSLFAALSDWLGDAIEVNQPAAIIFEAALPRSAGAGAQAGLILIGLVAVVELLAYRRGIPCYQEHVATIRKEVLGRGNATKDDAMRRCRDAGFDPPDHDASDAFVLWQYGLRTLSHVLVRERAA